MDGRVTKYRMFTGVVSDSTLKLAFKQLSLSSFVKYQKRLPHNYLKKTELHLPFPTTYLYKAVFSPCTLSKTTEAEIDR